MALGLGVALGMLGAGCETPEAPIWDVDLTVPITNDVHMLDELIEDEENIGVDSLGTLTLTVEQEIERVSIEDELQIDPFTDSATHELGVIEIETPAPSAVNYTFIEVWPPAAIWDGQYHQIPPFAFAVNSDLPAFTVFASATLATATCQVEVQNDLPVQLESAVLTFRNVLGGDVVKVATIDQPVPPGESGITTLDLAGAMVESQLAVEITGQAGGSAEPVMIDSQDGFGVELRFLPPVTVSAAVTTVSPQTIVRAEVIELAGGAQAGVVEFLDGWLEIELDNATALDAVITITLPEFASAGGDTLSAATQVLPGGRPTLGFDLAGATYTPEQAGEVQVRASLAIDSGGELVPVTATDQVRVAAALADPARVAAFTGVLEPTAVTIEPTTTSIDLPDGLDNVVFAAANMVFEVDNAAGFPIDLEIELVGTNAARQTVAVEVVRQIQPSSGATPTRTTVVLDETNSNIVELMNLMPTSIELSGAALIGDGITTGTVRRGDYIEGTATLRAPLEIELLADRMTTDPSELDIDEDTREIIRDNVSYGAITADISNHLPIGATINLIISHTESGAGDPDSPDNLVLSGYMAAPTIAPDGRVAATAPSRLIFDLDKDDLVIFETAPLYTGVVLDIDGSGGRTVRFLATDWVGVQAVATMKTSVDVD